MKRYERLLVGVDLAPHGASVAVGSRCAAREARWLAERLGASITLFHSTWADTFEDGGRIQHGTSAEGTAALSALAAELASSGVPVEEVASDGRPWQAMIQRVLRGENDLVCIGRRNLEGSGAIGANARKLLRKCPVPVWVVKPVASLDPPADRTVLAATDLSSVGDQSVELAAGLARLMDCRLVVVHAWQASPEVGFAIEVPAEQRDALAAIERAATDHVERVLKGCADGLRVTTRIVRGAASGVIQDVVAADHVDLVVMGTLSRSGIAGLLIGNTAERLLERLECSTLTVKPDDFRSPVSA